uniref:Uncharacterized protein n=1 Tax=Arundo donax TaxID=35708 RepID=A0A0A9FJ44_ARUDO
MQEFMDGSSQTICTKMNGNSVHFGNYHHLAEVNTEMGCLFFS